MTLEKEARNLINQEKIVLTSLAESNGAAEVSKICEGTDLSQSAVMRSALNLEENGFLEIDEIVQDFASITEEGDSYRRGSLPERKVLDAILKGDGLNFGDISEKAGVSEDKTGLTIGWLKKKNWAEIEEREEGKVLTATEEGRKAAGRKGKDEELLDEFEKEDELSLESLSDDLQEQVSVLKDRGLLKVKERKGHRLSLTEKGEKVQNYDLELRKTVSRLDGDLIKSGEWREVDLREYNVTASTEPIFPGKRHPQRRIIEELRSILLRMGFEEIRGPMVESEFWNFDALFQAQNHPAREIHDTLSLSKPSEAKIPDLELLERVKEAHEDGVVGSKGWDYHFDKDISRRPILRSQTTADSVRYLAQRPEPPVKVFSIDKVFRRERIDYQHLAEFPQAEGIVMAEDLNFRNMLGYLKEILHEMGVSKIRFRPGYFPYTEPSAEADGYLPERDEWIELLGAGMFRPELLEPLGIDCPVLAWGIGFSRIAMIRMGIEDMRNLHNNDLEWLKNEPLG